MLSGLLGTPYAKSAYELIDFCKTQFGECMPAMSVYRILDFLEKESLVHKLHMANKYVACVHISCAHAHQIPQFLICNRCQKVQEIGLSKKTLNDLQETVESAGCHLVMPQLEMSCLCQDCIEIAV